MKTIMIMDVTAKRADLEKKAIEEKILKEIKKKKMEKDIQERFEKELARVATVIENNSTSWFYVEFFMDDYYDIREQEIIREVINRLSIFLKELGYEVCTNHEYTQSWKTRSGKFGYLTFKIPE